MSTTGMSTNIRAPLSGTSVPREAPASSHGIQAAAADSSAKSEPHDPFFSELATQLQEIQYQLEKKKDLFSGSPIEVRPLLGRLSSLATAEEGQMAAIHSLLESARALQGFTESLEDYSHDLTGLKTRLEMRTTYLQIRIDECRKTLSNRGKERSQLQREKDLAEERRQREWLVVSLVANWFRAPPPSSEIIAKAAHNLSSVGAQLEDYQRQLESIPAEYLSVIDRWIALSRFMNTVARIKTCVESKCIALGQSLPSSERPQASFAAAAAGTSGNDSQFTVIIPQQFFTTANQILDRLVIPESQLQRARDRLNIVHRKNDSGFTSFGAPITELHQLIGGLREIVGNENDLIRYVSRAFARMMEAAISQGVTV